jgi:hypothetical protein
MTTKPSTDQGTLFAPAPEEPSDVSNGVPDDSLPDEDPGYDPAAPTEPTPPYRGPWRDEGGMCSATCPALRSVSGFSRPYSDCQVTGYRVEPTKWPCEVRSVYEAVKRGPER